MGFCTRSACLIIQRAAVVVIHLGAIAVGKRLWTIQDAVVWIDVIDTNLPAVSGCFVKEAVHAGVCRIAFGSEKSHAKGVLSDDESVMEEFPRGVRRRVQLEGPQLPGGANEQVGKSVEVVVVSREPGKDNGLERGHIKAFEAV